MNQNKWKGVDYCDLSNYNYYQQYVLASGNTILVKVTTYRLTSELVQFSIGLWVKAGCAFTRAADEQPLTVALVAVHRIETLDFGRAPVVCPLQRSGHRQRPKCGHTAADRSNGALSTVPYNSRTHSLVLTGWHSPIRSPDLRCPRR